MAKEIKLSNMMQHYLSVKEKYNDCIVFYRLGDFYEMFFEDAVLVSKLLELTLTGRNCGLEERAPMCGFPFEHAQAYAAKLVEMGYKIAICDQLTEAQKGVMVERDVVRVITPGTVIEENLLDEKSNNYIANLYLTNDNACVVWSDITTGEFMISIISKENYINKINDILVRIKPKELILKQCDLDIIKNIPAITYKSVENVYVYQDWAYTQENCIKNIKNQFGESGYGELKSEDSAVICVGSMLQYLLETQKITLKNINKFTIESTNDFLSMDINTRRNLELVETVRDKSRKGSLLWLMDETKTSMGARLLKHQIENPLIDINQINLRLNATEELYKNIVLRDEIAQNLNNISDIERLCCKISYGSINPREILRIKESIKNFPALKSSLNKLNSTLVKTANESICDFESLYTYLDSAINPENPPIVIKDGNVIKKGFNEKLDEYRSLISDSVSWLNKLEVQEKEETGIKNLKIGYNSVFGYYIEVTKSNINLVPYRYTRKQTLTNAERYITPELKELENRIENARSEIEKLELSLYQQVKEVLLSNIDALLLSAKNIAIIDCLVSNSIIASKYNYCKPVLTKSNQIEIVGGRHPIVERINKQEAFVSNDTVLDDDENRTMIITGPNMAGKSTYMRQVALITLMAHIGSFVPAAKAKIGLVDKIFTRIGASDDLSFGQSTFMVEMVEVSNILKNATEKSLILLDEVGRGTATFDGLSIAWAVMEYISKNLKAKTLFSTHYHELSELEGILDGVKNYRVTIKEYNGNIIFLRKVVRGSANKSFGIEVAKLAGLPEEVIYNAQNILKKLETADVNKNITEEKLQLDKEYEQKNKNAIEVCNIIRDINIEKITPFEAMQILFDVSQKLK